MLLALLALSCVIVLAMEAFKSRPLTVLSDLAQILLHSLTLPLRGSVFLLRRAWVDSGYIWHSFARCLSRLRNTGNLVLLGDDFLSLHSCTLRAHTALGTPMFLAL